MRKPVINCLYFSLGDSVEQFKLSKYAWCQVINHFTVGGEKKNIMSRHFYWVDKILGTLRLIYC